MEYFLTFPVYFDLAMLSQTHFTHYKHKQFFNNFLIKVTCLFSHLLRFCHCSSKIFFVTDEMNLEMTGVCILNTVLSFILPSQRF